MDDYLEISVSDWGLTFSSAPLYFNLQWWLIITALSVMVARRIINNNKNKKLWQQAIADEKAEKEFEELLTKHVKTIKNEDN